MIIDTHAHYDDEAFDSDRDELIKSFKDNGIEAAVNMGASLKGMRDAVLLAHKYDSIFAAVGIHPDEVGSLDDSFEDELVSCTEDPKVVAIGEIGLDYHWDVESRELQKEWFIRQILIAEKTDMPISIHSRDAAMDTMDIVKRYRPKGIVHCYSYGLEQAKEYLDMGMYFGIGGVLTFKNSKKIKEVVEYLPMESLVLETDCPYLAPSPHRGERNSSLYLPLVAKCIADIKGITPEEVIRITNENAKKVFPRLKSFRA